MVLFVLFIFLISGWCKTVIRTRYIGERAKFYCHYKPALSKTHKHLCKRTTDKLCDIIASTDTKISPMKRFFLDDDAESRVVTVTINPVSDSDSGEYWCGVLNSKEEIIVFETVIFWAIPRTGYIGGELQMKCPYGGQYEDKGKYLLKLGSPTSLIHTEVGQMRADNGRFSLYDNTSDREFMVTIRNLEAEDSGKYMCGIKDAGQYPERQLTVQSVVSVTEYEGHNINISCKYQNARSGGNQKHFCQGQDPVKCLEQEYLDEDRLSLKSSAAENLFTVTISDLRAEDAGIYWCVEFGVRGPEFTSAVQITVRRDLSQVTVAVAASLAVAALLIGIGIFTLCRSRRRKTNGTDETQDTPMQTLSQTRQEEMAQVTNEYETFEIFPDDSATPDDQQSPLNIARAAVCMPSSPTDTITYSSIHFKRSADGSSVLGEDLATSEDFPCEYADIKYSANPR